MTAGEAANYLSMLIETLENDVAALFTTEGRAPFAIAREVLCYVDHLGSLFTGRSGRRTSEAAKAYIARYLADVDASYGETGGLLYDMYRHGTVHNFAPSKLRRKGQTITWLVYEGEREAEVYLWPSEQVRVRHLMLYTPYGSSKSWLPVSTRCLFDDLKSSIEKFRDELLDDNGGMLEKWNAHAALVSKPTPVG
jgi:hypothetical protein